MASPKPDKAAKSRSPIPPAGSQRGLPARSESKRSQTDGASQPPTLRRFLRDFRWEAVVLEPYKLATHKGGEFCGASRQVLIGHGNEPVKFHLRYFELEPGGFTSLERHRHCHVVIGVRGHGRVSVAHNQYRIKPFDLIYIGPNQAHQLAASGRERFGFFCIVDALRDKPRPA